MKIVYTKNLSPEEAKAGLKVPHGVRVVSFQWVNGRMIFLLEREEAVKQPNIGAKKPWKTMRQP